VVAEDCNRCAGKESVAAAVVISVRLIAGCIAQVDKEIFELGCPVIGERHFNPSKLPPV
jgi:hypothetical protein